MRTPLQLLPRELGLEHSSEEGVFLQVMEHAPVSEEGLVGLVVEPVFVLPQCAL